jgi:hypothetical protein
LGGQGGAKKARAARGVPFCSYLRSEGNFFEGGRARRQKKRENKKTKIIKKQKKQKKQKNEGASLEECEV